MLALDVGCRCGSRSLASIVLLSISHGKDIRRELFNPQYNLWRSLEQSLETTVRSTLSLDVSACNNTLWVVSKICSFDQSDNKVAFDGIFPLVLEGIKSPNSLTKELTSECIFGILQRPTMSRQASNEESIRFLVAETKKLSSANELRESMKVPEGACCVLLGIAAQTDSLVLFEKFIKNNFPSLLLHIVNYITESLVIYVNASQKKLTETKKGANDGKDDKDKASGGEAAGDGRRKVDTVSPGGSEPERKNKSPKAKVAGLSVQKHLVSAIPAKSVLDALAAMLIRISHFMAENIQSLKGLLNATWIETFTALKDLMVRQWTAEEEENRKFRTTFMTDLRPHILVSFGKTLLQVESYSVSIMAQMIQLGKYFWRDVGPTIFAGLYQEYRPETICNLSRSDFSEMVLSPVLDIFKSNSGRPYHGRSSEAIRFLAIMAGSRPPQPPNAAIQAAILEELDKKTNRFLFAFKQDKNGVLLLSVDQGKIWSSLEDFFCYEIDHELRQFMATTLDLWRSLLTSHDQVANSVARQYLMKLLSFDQLLQACRFRRDSVGDELDGHTYVFVDLLVMLYVDTAPAIKERGRLTAFGIAPKETLGVRKLTFFPFRRHACGDTSNGDRRINMLLSFVAQALEEIRLETPSKYSVSVMWLLSNMLQYGMYDDFAEGQWKSLIAVEALVFSSLVGAKKNKVYSSTFLEYFRSLESVYETLYDCENMALLASYIDTVFDIPRSLVTDCSLQTVEVTYSITQIIQALSDADDSHALLDNVRVSEGSDGKAKVRTLRDYVSNLRESRTKEFLEILLSTIETRFYRGLSLQANHQEELSSGSLTTISNTLISISAKFNECSQLCMKLYGRIQSRLTSFAKYTQRFTFYAEKNLTFVDFIMRMSRTLSEINDSFVGKNTDSQLFSEVITEHLGTLRVAIEGRCIGVEVNVGDSVVSFREAMQNDISRTGKIQTVRSRGSLGYFVTVAWNNGSDSTKDEEYVFGDLTSLDASLVLAEATSELSVHQNICLAAELHTRLITLIQYCSRTTSQDLEVVEECLRILRLLAANNDNVKKALLANLDYIGILCEYVRSPHLQIPCLIKELIQGNHVYQVFPLRLLLCLSNSLTDKEIDDVYRIEILRVFLYVLPDLNGIEKVLESDRVNDITQLQRSQSMVFQALKLSEILSRFLSGDKVTMKTEAIKEECELVVKIVARCLYGNRSLWMDASSTYSALQIDGIIDILELLDVILVGFTKRASVLQAWIDLAASRISTFASIRTQFAGMLAQEDDDETDFFEEDMFLNVMDRMVEKDKLLYTSRRMERIDHQTSIDVKEYITLETTHNYSDSVDMWAIVKVPGYDPAKGQRKRCKLIFADECVTENNYDFVKILRLPPTSMIGDRRCLSVRLTESTSCFAQQSWRGGANDPETTLSEDTVVSVSLDDMKLYSDEGSEVDLEAEIGLVHYRAKVMQVIGAENSPTVGKWMTFSPRNCKFLDLNGDEFSLTWSSTLTGSSGWPGAGNNPPLIVHSDEFVVYFRSDGSNNDWGWRFTASLCQDTEFVDQLDVEQSHFDRLLAIPGSFVVESAHNYDDNMDLLQVISTTNTEYSGLLIAFDPRTKTEKSYDTLSFRKNLKSEDMWHAEKFSGQESDWPGVGTHTPLFIPQQECLLHFKSDGGTNYWGYRFVVAPAHDPTLEKLQLDGFVVHSLRELSPQWSISGESVPVKVHGGSHHSKTVKGYRSVPTEPLTIEAVYDAIGKCVSTLGHLHKVQEEMTVGSCQWIEHTFPDDVQNIGVIIADNCSIDYLQFVNTDGICMGGPLLSSSEQWKSLMLPTGLFPYASRGEPLLVPGNVLKMHVAYLGGSAENISPVCTMIAFDASAWDKVALPDEMLLETGCSGVISERIVRGDNVFYKMAVEKSKCSQLRRTPHQSLSISKEYDPISATAVLEDHAVERSQRLVHFANQLLSQRSHDDDDDDDNDSDSDNSLGFIEDASDHDTRASSHAEGESEDEEKEVVNAETDDTDVDNPQNRCDPLITSSARNSQASSSKSKAADDDYDLYASYGNAEEVDLLADDAKEVLLTPTSKKERSGSIIVVGNNNHPDRLLEVESDGHVLVEVWIPEENIKLQSSVEFSLRLPVTFRKEADQFDAWAVRAINLSHGVTFTIKTNVPSERKSLVIDDSTRAVFESGVDVQWLPACDELCFVLSTSSLLALRTGSVTIKETHQTHDEFDFFHQNLSASNFLIFESKHNIDSNYEYSLDYDVNFDDSVSSYCIVFDPRSQVPQLSEVRVTKHGDGGFPVHRFRGGYKMASTFPVTSVAVVQGNRGTVVFSTQEDPVGDKQAWGYRFCCFVPTSDDMIVKYQTHVKKLMKRMKRTTNDHNPDKSLEVELTSSMSQSATSSLFFFFENISQQIQTVSLAVGVNEEAYFEIILGSDCTDASYVQVGLVSSAAKLSVPKLNGRSIPKDAVSSSHLGLGSRDGSLGLDAIIGKVDHSIWKNGKVEKVPKSKSFHDGSVIGVSYSLTKGQVIFTVGGTQIVEPIAMETTGADGMLYPAVSSLPGANFTLNIGQYPFQSRPDMQAKSILRQRSDPSVDIAGALRVWDSRASSWTECSPSSHPLYFEDFQSSTVQSYVETLRRFEANVKGEAASVPAMRRTSLMNGGMQISRSLFSPRGSIVNNSGLLRNDRVDTSQLSLSLSEFHTLIHGLGHSIQAHMKADIQRRLTRVAYSSIEDDFQTDIDVNAVVAIDVPSGVTRKDDFHYHDVVSHYAIVSLFGEENTQLYSDFEQVVCTLGTTKSFVVDPQKCRAKKGSGSESKSIAAVESTPAVLGSSSGDDRMKALNKVTMDVLEKRTKVIKFHRAHSNNNGEDFRGSNHNRRALLQSQPSHRQSGRSNSFFSLDDDNDHDAEYERLHDIHQQHAAVSGGFDHVKQEFARFFVAGVDYVLVESEHHIYAAQKKHTEEITLNGASEIAIIFDSKTALGAVDNLRIEYRSTSGEKIKRDYHAASVFPTAASSQEAFVLSNPVNGKFTVHWSTMHSNRQPRGTAAAGSSHYNLTGSFLHLDGLSTGNHSHDPQQHSSSWGFRFLAVNLSLPSQASVPAASPAEANTFGSTAVSFANDRKRQTFASLVDMAIKCDVSNTNFLSFVANFFLTSTKFIDKELFQDSAASRRQKKVVKEDDTEDADNKGYNTECRLNNLRVVQDTLVEINLIPLCCHLMSLRGTDQQRQLQTQGVQLSIYTLQELYVNTQLRFVEYLDGRGSIYSECGTRALNNIAERLFNFDQEITSASRTHRQIYSRLDELTLLLQFLQMLCDGQFLVGQNLMAKCIYVGPQQVPTNMIEITIDVFSSTFKMVDRCQDLENDQEEIVYLIKVALQALETLADFVQGPHKANQSVLINRAEIFTSLMQWIQYLMNMRTSVLEYMQDHAYLVSIPSTSKTSTWAHKLSRFRKRYRKHRSLATYALGHAPLSKAKCIDLLHEADQIEQSILHLLESILNDTQVSIDETNAAIAAASSAAVGANADDDSIDGATTSSTPSPMVDGAPKEEDSNQESYDRLEKILQRLDITLMINRFKVCWAAVVFDRKNSVRRYRKHQEKAAKRFRKTGSRHGDNGDRMPRKPNSVMHELLINPANAYNPTAATSTAFSFFDDLDDVDDDETVFSASSSSHRPQGESLLKKLSRLKTIFRDDQNMSFRGEALPLDEDVKDLYMSWWTTCDIQERERYVQSSFAYYEILTMLSDMYSNETVNNKGYPETLKQQLNDVKTKWLDRGEGAMIGKDEAFAFDNYFASIEIMVETSSDPLRIYFPIPAACRNQRNNPLVLAEMENVMLSVTRDSAKSKLSNFLDLSLNVENVIRLQDSILTGDEWYKGIVRFMIKNDAYWVLLVFCLTAVINILLLLNVSARNSSDDDYLDRAQLTRVRRIGYAHFAVTVVMFANFLLGPARVIVSNGMKWKDQVVNDVIALPTNDRTIIAAFKLLNDILPRRVWLVVFFLSDFQTIYYSLFVVFSALGVWVNVAFFAAHVLDMAMRIKILSYVLQSVFSNGWQVIVTFLFAAVIIWIYAVVGVYRFGFQTYSYGDSPSDFTWSASLQSAFWQHLDFGLRGPPIFDSYAGQDAAGKYVFDISYQILIIVILVAIVTGIIIDTFSQLRSDKSDIEKDQLNVCFVCSLSREIFERKLIKFSDHIDTEHNPWNYTYYKVCCFVVQNELLRD